MARAESITFQEFRTRFSTEEACRTELFRLRFPEGFGKFLLHRVKRLSDGLVPIERGIADNTIDI